MPQVSEERPRLRTARSNVLTTSAPRRSRLVGSRFWTDMKKTSPEVASASVYIAPRLCTPWKGQNPTPPAALALEQTQAKPPTRERHVDAAVARSDKPDLGFPLLLKEGRVRFWPKRRLQEGDGTHGHRRRPHIARISPGRPKPLETHHRKAEPKKATHHRRVKM